MRKPILILAILFSLSVAIPSFAQRSDLPAGWEVEEELPPGAVKLEDLQQFQVKETQPAKVKKKPKRMAKPDKIGKPYIEEAVPEPAPPPKVEKAMAPAQTIEETPVEESSKESAKPYKLPARWD